MLISCEGVFAVGTGTSGMVMGVEEGEGVKDIEMDLPSRERRGWNRHS